MALIREYKPLFKIRIVEHGIAAEPVTALRFKPTDICATALRDHGLLFKHRSNGFDIYYSKSSAGGDALIAAIDSRTRFPFTIRTSNPAVLDQYEPAIENGIGHQYYFDNLRSDEEIKLINNKQA